jgi:hypothetical protein
MKFVGKEDGSCDLIFEDHEIEIIKKEKKLIFTRQFFKDFSHSMLNILFEWELHYKNIKNKKINNE